MSDRGVYRRILRPLLFRLDPETAHNLAMSTLGSAGTIPLMLASLRRFQPPRKPVTCFGLTFRNRVGLAAGFDKNGVALPAWEALGFGFIEIGTVTAKAQPGNPKPRIFRYPKEEAIINRLGFNNDGAEVVAERLRRLRASGRWPGIPVGINIGKSKVTPIESAAEDYLHSFRMLQEFASYIVVNVSSPNTPGLRDLQSEEQLGLLLRRLQEENAGGKPLLVKIAPDLAPDDLTIIIGVCEANKVAGIIATN